MVMNKYTKHLLPALLAGMVTLYSTSATAGNEQRSGQAGATELLINPWARSSGWGGINTASVSGLEATFMNVAGLAGTQNTELIFSSTSWFADININAFGFSKAMEDGAVLGLSVMSMNFGDIEITTTEQPEGTGTTYSPSYMNIGLSYAKKFTDNISCGATVRMISESIPDMKASGVSLDAGVQYVAGDDRQIKFGISLKNVGPKMDYTGDGNDVTNTNSDADGQDYPMTYDMRAEAFELPSSLNIGGSYDFNINQDHRLTLAGNFTSNSFSKDQIGVGAEYGYKSYFMLRTGYVYEDGITEEFSNGRTTAFTGLNYGVSFELPLSNGTNFGIDYSYRAASPLASPNSIGVRVTL
jgi:hypothetical protein